MGSRYLYRTSISFGAKNAGSSQLALAPRNCVHECLGGVPRGSGGRLHVGFNVGDRIHVITGLRAALTWENRTRAAR
jgi:hypothetical protein